MNRSTFSLILFRSTIGLVVTLSILAIVQAPLGSILFTPEGGVKWVQFSLFLLAEIVFISILLGNKNYSHGLVIKTLLLFVLVSLLVAGGEVSWVHDALDQVSTVFASQTQALDSFKIGHVKTILNVPVLMVFIFGIWFFRTVLWPALSRQVRV